MSWLCEMKGSTPFYLKGWDVEGSSVWTLDVNDALRCERQSDAQQIQQLVAPNVAVPVHTTEHEWV